MAGDFLPKQSIRAGAAHRRAGLFSLGRYDWVVTAEVAQRYFADLEAPRGKQLIWFEQSGHWPHFTEPEKYRDLLVNKILPETAPGATARLSPVVKGQESP